MGNETAGLENFGEFFGEGALRARAGALAGVLLTAARRALFSSVSAMRGLVRSSRSGAWSRSTHGTALLTFRLRRLRRVGPEQAIFEGCSIETADDGTHLFRIGRFDKSEALRFLRFGVADHFNRVRDQVLGAKPALDIVRGHPSGQIAQKDGKTHSAVVFNSI